MNHTRSAFTLLAVLAASLFGQQLSSAVYTATFNNIGIEITFSGETPSGSSVSAAISDAADCRIQDSIAVEFSEAWNLLCAGSLNHWQLRVLFYRGQVSDRKSVPFPFNFFPAAFIFMTQRNTLTHH